MIYDKQQVNEFEQSVIDLASKLPQWNSEDMNRRKQSSVSSMFEEVGELCGLVSKYRTRKHYYKLDPSELDVDDYKKIRNKFIDESGDALWVITSSLHSLLDTSKLFLADLFERTEIDNTKTNCLDEALFDLVDNVSILHQELCFNDKNNLMDNLEFIIASFMLFVDHLTEEYKITLENIIENNMIKLGNRYTKDGQRTDGK